VHVLLLPRPDEKKRLEQAMELAGLEPATSWVRLAPSLFGRDSPGLLRSRRLCQVRSDSLSSVSRLVARMFSNLENIPMRATLSLAPAPAA
jgi:hypothetical protein